MLKTRIIPTLLWKNYGLVKGVAFDSWRRIGSVIPAIKVYNTRQVDELVLFDILASDENRDPDCNSINDFSSECFMPLTVGGGVKKIEDIRNLLKAGADKVSINSWAYEKRDLISEGANQFGSQCIVVSIDAKKTSNGYECVSHAGKRSMGLDAVEWAMEVERLGAGEIILNSVEKDGTMEGYEIDLIKKVSSAVKIPVIAAGGAGSYEDMYKALKDGGAHSVSAASIFHFTQQTPLEAKTYLKEKGVNVRLGINQF